MNKTGIESPNAHDLKQAWYVTRREVNGEEVLLLRGRILARILLHVLGG